MSRLHLAKRTPQGITCTPSPRTALGDTKEVSRWHEGGKTSHPFISEVYPVGGCGLDLTPHLEWGMRKEYKDMDNDLIVEDLFKKNESKMDMVIKCWRLSHGARCYNHHCGEHTKITEACA